MLRASDFGDVTRFDLAATLLGRGRYWTTAYLVGDTLIDSGCAHTVDELVAALGDRPVARIINTHTHEDHIGANGRLQSSRSGLEVLAHPKAAKVLEDPRKEQPLHPYRKVMWGWPEACRPKPLADGEVVEGGGFRFEVIYTPGHSEDHISLYEAQRGWLFTGDLFVGGRDRALRQDADIRGIIASLKRINERPARTLFPGCARVRTNPAEAITDKVEYLESLGERVVALAARGRSQSEIVRTCCGRAMKIELLTLGHFARRHLVRSYLLRAEIRTPSPQP